MKLSAKFCPTCAEPANKIGEVIHVNAFISFDEETQTFEYDGESEIFYDNQRPYRDDNGMAQVACSNGHVWDSKLDK